MLSWVVPVVIASCAFGILVSIVHGRGTETLKIIVLSICLIGGSIFAQNEIESMNKEYSSADSASTSSPSQISSSSPSPSEVSSQDSSVDYHGRVN